MNILRNIACVISLLSLASCTDEGSLGGIGVTPDTADSKFYFSAQSAWHDVATRGGVSGSNNSVFQHNNFAVFAAMTHNANYIGASHHFNRMYRSKIEKIATQWQYVATNNDYYFDLWSPNGLHSFFAFAPYDAISTDRVDGSHSVTLAPAAMGTKVTPSLANFRVPTNSIKKGVDLMYASAMNIEGNNYPADAFQGSDFPAGGEVNLKFYHALSQVSFDFKLHSNLAKYLDGNVNDYIKVNKVGFTHVKNSGTFSFHYNGNAEWMQTLGNTNITWGGNDEEIFTGAKWSSTLGTAKTVSSIPHSAADGKTYIATMIPQEFSEDAAIVLEYYRESRKGDANGGVFTNTYLLNDIASLPTNTYGNKLFKQGENYKFLITIDNGNEVKFSITLSPWHKKEAILPL